MLKEKIKEGKPLNTEAIEFMKEKLMKEKDKKIISFLANEMQKCREYNHDDRPEMKVVSDQLQTFSSCFDTNFCGIMFDQVTKLNRFQNHGCLPNHWNRKGLNLKPTHQASLFYCLYFFRIL